MLRKGRMEEIDVKWRIKSRWNFILFLFFFLLHFTCGRLLCFQSMSTASQICHGLTEKQCTHQASEVCSCREQKTWSKNCSSTFSKCLLSTCLTSGQPVMPFSLPEDLKWQAGVTLVNLSFPILSKGWNSCGVCHLAWRQIVLVSLRALLFKSNCCRTGICLPFL